ncbi:hypothetical protein ACJDU8_17050 [Clostridium sp. WILCCON 0269]|uniref:Type I restriction enzyme R protein N-terminal domain-containing protein n=1 Tax=Candidatus Clostridium eludens TaxID=3381663 RepID=A0ABW8SPI3_9CLOT
MYIEECYNILEKQIKTLENFQQNNLSETDTRCKIIDFIFKEVLKFDEKSITREPSYFNNNKVNYIDYIFETNDNKFLLEAKKSSILFNLPVRGKKFATSVLVKDKNFKEAFNQANRYCEDKKINVGCISNGIDFIVFVRNNFKGRYNSYIFRGLEDLLDDFLHFYNIFNPYYSAESAMLEILNLNNTEIRDIPQHGKCLNDIIYDSYATINRNPIDIYIKDFNEIFLSDLISDRNIKYMEKCYCSQESIDKYNRQFLNVFEDSIPNLNLPVIGAQNFKKEYIKKSRNASIDIFLPKREVMILVGGVGAGKTTFLNRFFKNILPEEIRKETIWINMDFLKESRENIDVKDVIYVEAINQIRTKYEQLYIDDYDMLKEIYKNDIERLKKGALRPIFNNDKVEFERKISDFLVKKTSDEVKFGEDVLKYFSQDPIYHKIICITIDNADQKSEEFQIKCITAAHDVSMRINSIVILSMREDSFWRLKNINPLDAYRGNAYHIAAPSVSEVLRKRILAGAEILGNIDMLLNECGKSIKIKVKQFLSILSDSLFDKGNNKMDLFDKIAANNIRLALEMLSTFLISGHTNTKEYIMTYLTNGNYVIPSHAFIRSIALGDYKYYHSDKSLFINIIEIDNDGFYSHFTKLRILRYLWDKVTVSSVLGKGFISIDSIYSDFNIICNSKSSFEEILDLLLNKRLIESEAGYRTTCKDAQFIKITSAGYYYLNVLVKRFSYIERLCEDTSINSKKYLDKLKSFTDLISTEDRKNKQLEIRLDRVSQFLNYLKEEENNENIYIENTGINYKFMGDIIDSFEKERDKILGKKQEGI